MPETLDSSSLGESSLGRLLEEGNKQVLKRDESRKGPRVVLVVVMESEARLKFQPVTDRRDWTVVSELTEALEKWCGRNSEQVSLLMLSNKDQS